VLCIATRTDDNGRAFPGYETLSKDTGMTVRSVRRLLEQIPVNVVEIIPGGSVKGKPRRSTTYRILIPDHAHKGQDHAPDAHGAASRYKQDPAPDAHSSALDRAPDVHSQGNGGHVDTVHDRAHTRTPTVRVQATTVRVHDTDRAPDAHLTVLTENNSKEVTVVGAATSAAASHNGVVKEKDLHAKKEGTTEPVNLSLVGDIPNTPVTKKKKKKVAALSFDEVIAMYKDNPAYKGIDVAREAYKCRNYYEAKGKQFTRQKFVGWLGRIDPPITTNNRNSPVRGASDETRELLARKPARTL
jgi:hypothetical protein